MFYAELTDSTGAKWRGDTSDAPLTEADWDRADRLFGNFPDLENVTLEIGGAKHYFNPAHIIAVSITEDAS